ncbi:MAG: DUF6493 family protein [Planctomycetota bacterium]
MTYEELERLVSKGKPKQVADALSQLTEAERRKLSVQTATLFKAVRDGMYLDERASEEVKEVRRRVLSGFKHNNKTVPKIVRSATVAALGVCSLKTAKQINAMPMYNQQEDGAVLQVLSDRKPDWLQKWVEQKLDSEWAEIDWALLRGLIKTGACEKPTSDGYVRFFATRMGSAYYHTRKEDYEPPSQILREEPDLIDDIWRIFEVECEAFTYCWAESTENWRKHRPENYEFWPDSLLSLIASGHLDRDRLLDATLGTLTQGFKNTVLSGTTKMHLALEPVDDEIAARQQMYLDLLSAQASQVVTFAIKMLKRLAKAKRLDPDLFLSSAGRVFALTTKSQPKAVLSMAKPLMKKHPEHRAKGFPLAFEGLTHVDADVQSASLKLILAYADDAPEDAGHKLAALLDDMPATLRPDAEALLKELGGTAAERAVEEAQQTEVSMDAETTLAGLRERAEAIDLGLRDRLGVDAAITALEQGDAPPPLAFSITDARLLGSLEPIQPIETVDELMDATTHAVERIDSPDEVERLIDGIVRLCDQRTDDFGARMAPALKRIMTADQWQPFAPCEVPLLVLAWLSPNHNKKFGRGVSEAILSFMSRRIREATDWVKDRRPRQLLSIPTHAGGWIDPRIFVQRLIETQGKGLSIGRCDLILALLRLAPDGRDEALDAAAELRYTEADAVRWALGDELRGVPDPSQAQSEAPAQPSRGKLARLVRKVVGGSNPETPAAAVSAEDVGLWLAAGRCQDPFGQLVELESAGIKVRKAGGTAQTLHQFTAEISKTKHYGTWYEQARVKIDTQLKDVEFSPATITHCPTALLYRKASNWSYFEVTTPWVLHWVESTWPINNDPILIGAVHGMTRRVNENSSSRDPNHALLQGLFLPDRVWDGTTRLSVWIALAGKDADVRGVATDALIEAIDDGRAHPDEMGQTLQVLSPHEFTGWLKLNRIGENMEEVARVSDLHAWFVATSLQYLVATWDKPPRNAHHVLGVLLETMTRVGLRPTEQVQSFLSPIKGSSKTTKLAGSLLKLGGQTGPTKGNILAGLADARIERAERWSSAKEGSAGIRARGR